jgi:SAM-dependent methyltransferase
MSRFPTYDVEQVNSYYHRVLPFYEAENEARNDLEFWQSLVAEQKPDCVLELGAGTGRVTAALREFAPVVALDLSLEMLKRASERLRGLGGGASFPTQLVVADMRSFAFARRFDLIVASNDPFSHIIRLRERETALRRIRNHLGPCGRFVFEGLYRPQRKIMEVPERSVNGLSLRETWKPLGANDCWRSHYHYQRGIEQVDAKFVARAWNPAELKTQLASCGLRLREIWGDFDRRPFALNAQRIIVVADRSPSAS